MSRELRSPKSEVKSRWTELTAVAAIGAAAIGWGVSQSSQEAPSTSTYTCSNPQEFNIKPGDGLDKLLNESGATEQAGDDSEQLLRALAHKAHLNNREFPETITVDLTGSIPSVNVPLRAGGTIALPTICERDS